MSYLGVRNDDLDRRHRWCGPYGPCHVGWFVSPSAFEVDRGFGGISAVRCRCVGACVGILVIMNFRMSCCLFLILVLNSFFACRMARCVASNQSFNCCVVNVSNRVARSTPNMLLRSVLPMSVAMWYKLLTFPSARSRCCVVLVVDVVSCTWWLRISHAACTCDTRNVTRSGAHLSWWVGEHCILLAYSACVTLQCFDMKPRRALSQPMRDCCWHDVCG
jgi:hypothetical protein